MLLLCIAVCSYGQYTQSNSFIRKALVSYKMGSDGFYYKSTDEMVDRVDNIVENYAYDVKAQNLYVLTANSNCIVTLNKDYAKIIKKNKTIPQLKGDAIDAEILRANGVLEAKFEKLNANRRQHLADSIAKVKADSIARAKADSIRLAKIAQEKENYRNAHNWRWVPVGNTRMTCTMCDESISYKDSILCLAVKNDTIYHVTREDLALGNTYLRVHKYPIPMSLKKDEKFKYHYEVFGDSLKMDKLELCSSAEDFNSISFFNAVEAVKKDAPYGYFEDWEWDDEYSSISFYFRYTNTNKKTIKYINVFFVVTNSVGDVRKSGNFQGTGPLAEFETASWNWDHSSYYVAGDASNMNISKVILTYMDGTQKVLTKNMLRFE